MFIELLPSSGRFLLDKLFRLSGVVSQHLKIKFLSYSKHTAFPLFVNVVEKKIAVYSDNHMKHINTVCG
jgi:hypothetical protein